MKIICCILVFLFIFVLFLLCCHHFKRKRAQKKVRCKTCTEKTQIINKALKATGFYYDPCSDLITSQLHPWQRDFGYQYLYDESAPYFGMIIQREPIYFDYDNRTWLLELWKGQYGITVGSEIGIYYADHIIPPQKRKETLFKSISDCELMPLSNRVYLNGKTYYYIHRRHWWLTGFVVGDFAYPGELTQKASITFPIYEMMSAFVDSLVALGYTAKNVSIDYLTVTIRFTVPHTKPVPTLTSFRVWHVQLRNRFLAFLFRQFTKPYRSTQNRLVYLRYYSPFLFYFLVKINFLNKTKKRRRCHGLHETP